MKNIILDPQNKTSDFRIIKPHFTEARKIITFSFLILTLSLLNITFLNGSILGLNINIINSDNSVSALTYSNSTDLSFTFNPTLSISLSSNTISIDNLAPGQVADSEPITVSVSSNAPYGYALYASIGNNTDYATSDLVHEDSNISSSFQSIATNANLSNLTEDNTWGYSYKSTLEGSNWSSYNGLPLYNAVDNSTGTENPALLIDTKDPADSTKAINFKLAAKASSTQASGTYNNVINFYAIGKPEPLTIKNLTYMQDFKTISETDKQSVLYYMQEGEQYTLQDSRESGKPYYIAKLKDGNVWMTQNLDLNIISTKTYTPSDTDIPANWTPVRSTTTSKTWDASSTGYNTPHSYDPGNRYWNGIITSEHVTIEYNTTTSGDSHYHIGNYYNWVAAVAMNSFSGENNDTNQSICPAGWKLPTYYGNDKSYQNLLNIQNLTSGNSGNIQLNPTYFVYGGYWNGSSSGVGHDGYYWSSVAYSTTQSNSLSFGAGGYLGPQNRTNRNLGLFVRCVAR